MIYLQITKLFLKESLARADIFRFEQTINGTNNYVKEKPSASTVHTKSLTNMQMIVYFLRFLSFRGATRRLPRHLQWQLN